jgi:multiple sugar transport system permease protein
LKKSNHEKHNLIGYLFIAPQMLGFLFFVMMPLISIFIFSFQEKNLLFGTSLFAGLENYKNLVQDSVFSKTLVNTIVFSLGVVPINLILSLTLALYLGKNRFETFYLKTIVFIPVVTSGVAWAIVFKYILQGGTDGPLNYFLSVFGIQGPNWLHEVRWAMFSVIITRVLKNVGMNILIFLGAVLNLPQDVIEAAKIDGCKKLSMFFKIKLPLLMPSVLMVMIVTVTGSMRVFDTIKLMTDGGPEGSTMVIVYYIYHQAFKMFNTGYASAISVVLFLIILVLTLLQWKVRRRVSYYEN